MTATKDKLCHSCSGPLSDFAGQKLPHPDFCPHCVDQQGRLLSYKDILDGMIDYIQSDHPEIDENKQHEQAVEWLEEGPVWGAVFEGVIIAESLEDQSLLDNLQIVSSRESTDDDPQQNHDFPTWHLHTVQITRRQAAELVEKLKRTLREGKWWTDLKEVDGNDVYIVFRNKLFVGDKRDAEFTGQVNQYAKNLGLPVNQLPFSDAS